MKLIKFISAVLLSLFICTACSDNSGQNGTSDNGTKTSKHSSAHSITAAGSSFVYPVLSKWADVYNTEKGVKINYQPIGSGGGLRQLTSKTVDFAASDKPLTIEELNKEGKIQFPVIVGGIVPVVNIPGIKSGQLVLNGETLANIFLGKIKKWNDPAILKLNPGLKLPDSSIIIIRRADGSGTTFNFTNYLSKVSPEWKEKVGFSTDVQWPGMTMGAKGNAGVAAQVKTIPNTIGYVEYAFVKYVKIPTVDMINSEGTKVSPSLESFESAAANAKWNADNGFYLFLTDAPGKDSWPIVATTWVLMYKNENPEIKKTIFNFFSWAYAEGKDQSKELDYVSIPDSVTGKIENYWKSTE